MAREVTKESVRQEVWNYLEANDIACFPRPVFHRIPNFKGSQEACAKIQHLKEFQNAQTVKVNPDKPQQHIRLISLETNKILLVPTPRLRNGLFNKIMPPPGSTKKQLHICSTSEGVKNYSVPIGLNTKIKIDLVIIGSVAVSRAGHRIGKGEGYADMEYAMMTVMGAVDAETIVISTIHDCQLFDTLPEHLFKEHDVTVDVIVTPTQIIHCEPRLPKPKGIIWSLLTEENLKEIPILRTLRWKEEKDGKNVKLKCI